MLSAQIIIDRNKSKLRMYRIDGRPLLFTDPLERIATKQVSQIPCITKGLHDDYTKINGSTPSGIFEVGIPIKTEEEKFGGFFIELIDFLNLWVNGRAGIGIHGGHGFKDFQNLGITQGCVRLYNKHLNELVHKIITLKKFGKIYIIII